MPTADAHPPLHGLLVLDFTRVIAGPFLTQMLGDMGARVIKVEAPGGGDDFRHYKPDGWSGDAPGFMALNRNKESVVLDIRTAPGQAACRELAARADVLIENFRPDVMRRHGLDHARLAEINPRLVYCSISGYGHGGRYEQVAGYDPIAQAETGMMYLTGDAAMPPQKAGASVADSYTSLHAGMAVMAALMARHRTGLGQHVDVALFDSMFSVQGYMAQLAMMTGEDPPRAGNRSILLVPMGDYECADGTIMLVVGNDRQYRKFCLDVIERPDLVDAERYGTLALRLRNRQQLEAEIASVLRGRPRAYWVERLRAAGVPGGSVRTPREAVVSEEVRDRGLIWDSRYGGEAIQVVGSPMRLSANPLRKPGPVPLLGEHTEAVLRELLDYDDEQIARLREVPS
ncbi:MAG: CoA transferase [Gammaproteobacteria bacterium]|nr:CoA transferase [Gammaproteobacteria bacterium]